MGKDALDPELFGVVPANIKLVPYAPQAELLRRARLCIFHAGLNTALDCLENGVPMVAIPIASEQPGIAMRIARLGAGLVVSLAKINAASLNAAVQAALIQPDYREAAVSVAREIARLDSAAEAVQLTEQVLSVHGVTPTKCKEWHA
jgi:UDP:flavonoid glycosyltransferase YjiC (YdhE family)